MRRSFRERQEKPGKRREVPDVAVTSIWSIKGWLGKVVIYIENPEKTRNPEIVKLPELSEMGEAESQGLSDVIAYAVNAEKTKQTEAGEGAEQVPMEIDDEREKVMQQYVSGVNCTPATARFEMMAVKKRYGKEEGIMAFHGYQSFAPGECTPAMAHEIGVKLAEKLWGDRFQVLVATHLDKAHHLHNHFVVNSVSFLDGKRYHRTNQDYRDMRKISDDLCRRYRLSVIEKPQAGRSKHYGEWRAEREQCPTWRGMVRADVDEAIRQSMTERQFFDALRKKGYEAKSGKDISVRPPGKERFVRLARNFGEEYTIDGICKRILSQSRRLLPELEPECKVRRVKVKGDLKTAGKITGFRALYFHYCYLLGLFPRGKQQNKKHIHFLLREDLQKMDAISEEMRLLARHHIDTAEQLSSYKNELEYRKEELMGQRGQLYRKRRTVAVKSDEGKLSQVKTEITALSEELAKVRREMKLCDDIAMRSGIMKEKLKTIGEDRKNPGKEKKRDEQFRGRSGTDR